MSADLHVNEFLIAFQSIIDPYLVNFLRVRIFRASFSSGCHE